MIHFGNSPDPLILPPEHTCFPSELMYSSQGQSDARVQTGVEVWLCDCLDMNPRVYQCIRLRSPLSSIYQPFLLPFIKGNRKGCLYPRLYTDLLKATARVYDLQQPPVNILDELNWDQCSVGVPSTYTGLLHYHHRSM
ncbi:hypothetical protein F2P81_023790 [Scophthalmus maximus]|uniref:Uncharacterized protein n=1 Tax=Scophthalmus maximus TaxID=52904 RepID=A0A6A4RUV9_SCOMX|nr:hypothetical protein F2P81_023790 [Scophthalmus maximus]